MQFMSADALRAFLLHSSDRSFPVTYWLQAMAISISLFGVAASIGAQVLARRKEFGLLAQLGLTRSQIMAVVAAEGTAWTAVGAAVGLMLGLTVSVVLAGTLTAWVAGRAAAGRDAVIAVKEDW